jgi:hypothetical protein
MKELLESESRFIPEGQPGSDQMTFRSEFIAFRRESLAADPLSSPREDLLRAIASVRRYAPEFKPEYDAGFFAE